MYVQLIYIVRFGFGPLSDVTMLRPNILILWGGGCALNSMYGASTVAKVGRYSEFLLLECTEQIEPDNPKEIELIPFGLRVFDFPHIVFVRFSRKTEAFSRPFSGSPTNPRF